MKKDQYLDLLIILTSYKLRFILYLIAAAIQWFSIGVITSLLFTVVSNIFNIDDSIFFSMILIAFIITIVISITSKRTK